MQFEREKLRIESATGLKKAPSAYGRQFTGLKESDFSRDVTGTSWRRRESLGGAVTSRLKPDKGSIESWSIYRTAMVQWAYVDHRDPETNYLQAKFFAQLDEKYLRYGLYIERSNRPEDAKYDWNAFISWIRDDKDHSWLIETAHRNGLSVYDMKNEGPFDGMIVPDIGKWRLVDRACEGVIVSLADFLDDLGADVWVDLYIAKNVDKDEAIAHGIKIAEDISRLFEILMPLYEACCRYVR